jgi:hypothetical protein
MEELRDPVDIPPAAAASTARPGLDLYWIPLGAGADVVRLSGRAYEALSALVQRRPRRDLYHSALVAHTGEAKFVIEMTPIPDGRGRQDRGVVSEGPVGSRWVRRLRVFRYEIRRWREGVIPDISLAVVSPVRISDDADLVDQVLESVLLVPTPVWGRDELHAGEMWNSNSVVAWLLTRAGLLTAAGRPPLGGRAPGWDAGVVAAERLNRSSDDAPSPTTSELLEQVRAVAHDLPAFATAPLYRRWHLRWGATAAEIAGCLPGDSLQPLAHFRATRAITISAPPDAVWPWLVQVGGGRAGWYSNDLLDNLGKPSAITVVSDLQHLEVGQWVPMSPSGSPSDRTAFRVHSFQVNEWMLWTKPDSTWAWHLTLTDDGGTRLVTRIHAVYDWHHPLIALSGVVLMEFGDFAMCRRMLRGVKARSETLARADEAGHPVTLEGVVSPR